MSTINSTEPIHSSADPRWGELAAWLESQPAESFPDGQRATVTEMTPEERAGWHAMYCRPEFSTPCPDWCTITKRGRAHSDDLTRSGHPMTSHCDDGFRVGDFEVSLIREDIETAGTIKSETKIVMFGGDGDTIDVSGLLAWADALRLAAGKYAPLLGQS